MKKLLLLGLLIILGNSIVMVTPQGVCACQQLAYEGDCNNMPGCTWETSICQEQDCTTYQQTDCLKASKYCQWNINDSNCTTFGGCASLGITSPTNYKYCRQSNAQCIPFNGTSCEQYGSSTFSSTCSNYNQTYCTENVGTDGVCLWMITNQTCSPITQCSQANQSSCSLLKEINGLACQYIGNACTQITNCSAFQSKETCKYYFPSLTSPDMILCQWNTLKNSCQNATNSTYLTNTNCLTGTGYNYRWLPTASNPSIGVCATCKVGQLPHVTVISRSQCLCSQYILQADCSTPQCQWNAQTNQCSPISCVNVKSQSLCITIISCYWNFQNGGCQAFSQEANCASLPITVNSLICAAQNVYCPGFADGICQGGNTLSKCSASTTQAGCTNWAGSDGICKWANGLCTPLTNCAQIMDSVYCGNWQNQCEWNPEIQLCQQLTCASYNSNPSKCMYVLTGFQQSEYQLCRYDKELSICYNAYSGLGLTSETCSSHTANTYRWSQLTSTEGMCATCSLNSLQQAQTNATCRCSQFLLQAECINSGFCTYNQGTCSPNPCSSFLDQTVCASKTNCYWNPTIGCSNFTSCSTLSAQNQLECLQQNVSCRGFTGNSCSTTATLTCAQIYTTGKQCIGTIGSYGVCYLNGNNCNDFDSCYNLTASQCKKFHQVCQINQGKLFYSCEPVACPNFSELNCNYYFLEPAQRESIQNCLWDSKSRTCIAANEVLTQLASSTCAANTNNTFRWVTTTNNQGYCVKCQEEIQLKSQCPCYLLSTQSDCIRNSSCYWTDNGCQAYSCQNIQWQSLCASQSGCIWSNNSCSNFSGTCSTLMGSNQLQCMFQQKSCVGTNGTTCTNTLNTCESNKSANGCVEQVGSNGVCYWNTTKKSCISVTQCSQLPETICKQKSSACYFSNSQCQPMTCQQLYLLTGFCTYVINLVPKSKVQNCILDGSNCLPITDPFSLKEELCYINSAGTSRWVPNTKDSGICITCSNNLTPISSQGKCQCFQFITEQDCLNSITSCYWTDSQLCSQLACTNITTQFQCVSASGCAWSINANKIGSCGDFVSCSSVAGASLNVQNCLAYSSTCSGYNGTTCTEKPTAPCFSYKTQSQCNNNSGPNEICIYNTSEQFCQTIWSCDQIQNAHICNYFSNICAWIGMCVPTSCWRLKDCTFIITSFSGKIQLCQQMSDGGCWDATSLNFLDQENCTSNTALTHRWVPIPNNVNVGYCASCQRINKSYIQQLVPGQCQCSQLYSKIECNQNNDCLWLSGFGACFEQSCNAITIQEECATNPACFWSYGCQSFQSCQQISGRNAAECFSYSIQCGSLSTIEQSYQQYYCQTPTENECITNPAATTQALCENTSIQGGVCQWLTTQGCVKVAECSQVSSSYICSTLLHFCVWIAPSNSAAGFCQQTSCTYLIEDNCNYFLTGLGVPSTSTISYCQWSTTSSTCIPATSILTTFTQANCYENSMMMYRWSSNSTTSGLCVSCNQQYILKQVCSCSTLSQQECLLASPNCIYNDSQCTDFSSSQCGNLTNQIICAQQSKCIWNNATCVTFSSCSTITQATSPLDCLSQSIFCPVYNSTATDVCSPAIACDKQKSLQNCQQYNTQVAIGYCIWIGECQLINNCSYINEINLCALQINRCLWNFSSNLCGNYYCSAYSSQATCTFVYTSYVSEKVTLCQWNSAEQTCVNATPSQAASYNSTNCYTDSGHTYHYDGTQCIQCYQGVLVFTLATLQMLLF